MDVIGFELDNGDTISHISIMPSTTFGEAHVGVITGRGRVLAVTVRCGYETEQFGDDDVIWEPVVDLWGVVDHINKQVRHELN